MHKNNKKCTQNGIVVRFVRYMCGNMILGNELINIILYKIWHCMKRRHILLYIIIFYFIK